MTDPAAPSSSGAGLPADDTDPLARIFGGPAHLGTSSRRRPVRRLVAGGAAAAVLLVGGVAVAGTSSPSSAGYRTATAGTRPVDQVLDGVATIEPVSQASVAFPVEGTIATVLVSVGDRVAVGQVLATLDRGSLEAAKRQDQAALDQAELLLERALAGEDVAAGGGTGGAGGTSAASATPAATPVSYASSTGEAEPASPSDSTPMASTTDSELQAAQQAVLDAQRQVDLDLNAARTALDSATRICSAIGDDEAVEDLDDGVVSEQPVAPPAEEDPAEDDPDVAACRDALQAVLDAQELVAADQAALLEAAADLTSLLDERLSEGGDPSPDASTTPGSGVGGLPETGGSSDPAPSTDGAPGSVTSSPSAEDLIALQKAVDAAAARVSVAEQALDQAEIVSPLAGTVVAVELAVGDDVTAGSSTATVVVVGEGGFEVTTTVSVDDLADLALGQAATIAPDGNDTTLTGEVVAIGVAPSTAGSVASYPVTIGLTGEVDGLGNGATASVSIVTDAAGEALAVPTSAVDVDGDRHTVTVVDGDRVEMVEVQVGALGDTWTEVTDGLEAGQEVALADLDEPLPGSATESTGSSDPSGATGPGAGGFPGGMGSPPAGFRPPG